MPPSWHELIGAVFRPERPRLSQCRARAQAYAARESRSSERRNVELADCRRRIEAARATVFAADDGIVGARMTELEREWITLARADRGARTRILEVWNEIAPPHWRGRLRWDITDDLARDLEAAVTLASDPSGVERAEDCALRFAAALSAWQPPLGSRLTWSVAPVPLVETRAEVLLAAPLVAIQSVVAASYGGPAILARAFDVERDVLALTSAAPALRDSEPLAADIAFAARVHFLWQVCLVDGREVGGRSVTRLDNPVDALRDLWSTGYALGSADCHNLTLVAAEA